MNEDEMLTAEDVARIMKVSIKTVRKWVQSGELASIPIGIREYRISRRDLNLFIEEQRRKRQNPDSGRE
jgi:excisionase family DNA binding protein